MSIKVSLSGFGEAWCSLALAVKSRPGPGPSRTGLDSLEASSLLKKALPK